MTDAGRQGERSTSDDLLRRTASELHASRRRLVLAADADRRTIERELHEGVQQHAVALAVNLQLAMQAVDTSPAKAGAILAEMRGDVQRLLDDAAALAHRIYPSRIGEGGFAALLRAAAASADVRASIDVPEATDFAPETALTVYLAWLDTLEHESSGAPVTILMREQDEALHFDIAGRTARPDDDLRWIRDRIDALGGELRAGPEPGGVFRVAGTLPLSR